MVTILFRKKCYILSLSVLFFCAFIQSLQAQSINGKTFMGPDMRINPTSMVPLQLGAALPAMVDTVKAPPIPTIINDPVLAVTKMQIAIPSPQILNAPILGNGALGASIGNGTIDSLVVRGMPSLTNMVSPPISNGAPGGPIMQNPALILMSHNPLPAILQPVMGMMGPDMVLPGPLPGIQKPIMQLSSPMIGMSWPMEVGTGNPLMGNPAMNMHNPLMSPAGPALMVPQSPSLISAPLQNISPLPPSPPPDVAPPSPAAVASGLLVPPAPSPPGGPGGSCVFCHGDLQQMTDLGYPQFYFDPLILRRETGMPARCDDCHLGNPDDFTLDGAHVGVLGLLVMKGTFRDIVRRKDVTGLDYEKVQSIQFIRQSNTDDPRYRLQVQSPFHMLLWHDRNLSTASWNPDISMQTCGRCHPAQVAEFNTTEMGLVQNMSQYIPWIAPPVAGLPGTHLNVAPQSCGLWTEQTIPPNNDQFTDINRLLYNNTSTRIADQFLDPFFPETSTDPLTKLQSLANQKNCNKCHPSCLDCHYVPFEENIPAAMGPGVKPAGTHTVTKRPLPSNCMGIGRGQFCHGGATERRRGDGYLKGGFAHVPPPDLWTPDTHVYLDTPDIHYNGDFNPANATCVDCHGPLPGMGGPPPVHGDMERNPEPDRCAVCHPAVVAAYLTGTHRNLTCGACHTPKIVGYGFNFWAPGTRFGITPNPLDRHSRYAVNAMTPTLLIDENGMWAPYHVEPHITTHIDPLYLLVDAYISPRLLWRNQPDIGIIRQHPSKDGVAITGSYHGPLFGRDEGQVMTWLNVDKIAHSITSRFSALPPKNCIDCHTPDGTQRINVSFGWNDNPALVYEGLSMGTYDIIVDGLGIRIENLISGTPSVALDPMRGIWSVPGSYIIPPVTGPSIGHPIGIL
ncbi:MAG: hypothetical protein ACMUIP_08375 [bacterium]